MSFNPNVIAPGLNELLATASLFSAGRWVAAIMHLPPDTPGGKLHYFWSRVSAVGNAGYEVTQLFNDAPQFTSPYSGSKMLFSAEFDAWDLAPLIDAAYIIEPGVGIVAGRMK